MESEQSGPWLLAFAYSFYSLKGFGCFESLEEYSVHLLNLASKEDRKGFRRAVARLLTDLHDKMSFFGCKKSPS